jgi:hypothetical protein
VALPKLLSATEHVIDETDTDEDLQLLFAPGSSLSLALATHGLRAARGAVLGVLLVLQKQAREIAEGVRDFFGELLHPKPKPKPLPQVAAKAATVIRSEAPKPKANTPCKNCGSTCTILMSGGIGKLIVHCNECAANDGVLPPKPAGTCCSNYLPQVISGGTRCGNCGAQNIHGVVIANGARFSDLNSRRSRWGRFA